MPRPNLTKLKPSSGGKQVTISKFFSPKQPASGTRCNGGVAVETSSPVTVTDKVTKTVSSPFRKRLQESPPEGPSKKQKIDSSQKNVTGGDGEPSGEQEFLATPSTSHVFSQTKVAESTLQKLNSFSADFDSPKDSGSGVARRANSEELKRKTKLPDIDLDRKEEQNNEHDVNGSDTEGEDKAAAKQKTCLAKFSSPKSQDSTSNKAARGGGVKGKCKYTPLEQQYMEFKEKQRDAVLFVECGYKYRFFGEDAEIAARELNIYCHMDHNFMTASIPTHRLFVHVRRLVAKGYKVGVVKQTETAALKAAGDNRNTLFTRRLSALYTKSTLIGEDVDPVSSGTEATVTSGVGSGNYLMAVYEPETEEKKGRPHTVAFVAVQPSTGEIVYDMFTDTMTRSELETRISHVEPVELLLPKTLSEKTEKLVHQQVALSCTDDDRIRTERIANDEFEYNKAFKGVTEFFSQQSSSACDTGQTIESLPEVLKLPKPVIGCFHALLTYLQDFNLHRALKLTSSIRQFSTEDKHMKLNAGTVRNLELFHNLTDGRIRGSLIWVLDHTQTNFGARLLHKWLAKPLLDKRTIEDRLDAVTELLQSDSPIFNKLRELLGKLPDLERGLGTIYHRKCSTAEFLSVCRALDQVYQLVLTYRGALDGQVQCPLLESLLNDLPDLLNDIGHWVKAINERAAKEGDKTVLFTDESQFPAVQHCKQAIRDVTAEIHQHRREVRLTLKNPALEYVTVSGIEFLIEVKNSLLKEVPGNWVKISSTKAVSRFHSPFILSAYKRLNQQREQLVIESNNAWIQFLQSFEEDYPRYRQAVKHLSVLDCLFSLAEVAKQEGFSRPCFVDGPSQIHIEQGRHPVVDLLLGEQEQYVPNDTHLEVDAERCMIITGPNMGGKSSYIKQVALVTVLAHMGSYIPAESGTFGIIDAIYTRMGASDELFKGRSTFMVELQEASEVIAQATSRSLVILDELGRGTSTHDGVAIAYATLNYFVQETRCLTLFVTHYPELAEMEALHPGHVTNYHMSFLLHDKDTQEVEEDDGSPDIITFLYQLVQGMAARSYGLNVARLADIPDSIVKTGTHKSKDLESKVTGRRSVMQRFRQLMKETEDSSMLQLLGQLIETEAS